MLKPSEDLINLWVQLKSVMSFKYKDGQIKQGVINCCHGLGMHVNFGVADKKVVTFDSLESITESDVAILENESDNKTTQVSANQ